MHASTGGIGPIPVIAKRIALAAGPLKSPGFSYSVLGRRLGQLAEVALDAVQQKSAALDGGFAVTKILAIKYNKFLDDLAGGKLLPAQVNVTPLVANQ